MLPVLPGCTQPIMKPLYLAGSLYLERPFIAVPSSLHDTQVA